MVPKAVSEAMDGIKRHMIVIPINGVVTSAKTRLLLMETEPSFELDFFFHFHGHSVNFQEMCNVVEGFQTLATRDQIINPPNFLLVVYVILTIIYWSKSKALI